MCNRIRALEDALSEASYALNSSRMHPLLRPELLEIKHYTSARFVNRDERKEREKREKVKVKDGEGAMEVDRKVLKSFEKLILEGERRNTEDEEGVPVKSFFRFVLFCILISPSLDSIRLPTKIRPIPI